ncbi:MAG: baseplate J/gp47 family protein, partial [Salinimicrobium sediminis]|nr:baseplate J/gp47 family protein [Salinimicrobium sediminis]
MAWNRPTLNDLIVRIENDITSRLTGLIPLLSRALLKVLARVSAGAFDSVYGNQEFNSEQVNVGTAAETWLRRYAFQWGVEIQDATFANGFYKFFGTNGINIPINTILVRDDNIEYITTETGNIGDLVSGEITLAIECRSSGSIGNAPSNTPLELISPIVGVDTAGSIVGD